MTNNTLAPMSTDQLATVEKKFTDVCLQALDLELASNAGAAFRAAIVVKQLQDILSDQVIDQIFTPLMNTTVGFLTDKDPSKTDRKTGLHPEPYNYAVIRNCLIEAVTNGVLPTGNQFNIIAGRSYITNEGYSYLLNKAGVRFLINKSIVPASPESPFVDVKCDIRYTKTEDGAEKPGRPFSITVQCKQDKFSSPDQIKGKADRKAKKTLYELVKGRDIRDGDVVSAEEDMPVDEQAQPEYQAQARRMSIEEQKAAMRQTNVEQPTLL